MTANLASLLGPRSVALVGASPTSGGPASLALSHLRRSPAAPAVHLVNPRYAGAAGYVSRISEIPEVPDVAVIGVAARFVNEVIRDAAEHGVRTFVVLSGGFSELDQGGESLQRELTGLALEFDLTVLGPNCLGVMNFVTGAHLSFASALGRPGVPTRAGRCAFVSQSGALASYICAMTERSALFNYVFSMGNEASLTSADVLRHLAVDPDTDVIALYLESVRDGRAFLDAARLARSHGKEIVILPVGEGEASAAAAASHTAAMASSNVLTRMLTRRAGALIVDTPEQLAGVVEALLASTHPAGPRIGIVTGSGGGGAILAERIEKAGLRVHALTDETKERMRAFLPDYVSPTNPCDTGAAFYSDPELLTRTIEAMTSDPGIDQIITIMGAGGPQSGSIAHAIERGHAGTDKVGQVVWFALPDEVRELDLYPALRVAPSLDEAVSIARALVRVELPLVEDAADLSIEAIDHDAVRAAVDAAVRTVDHRGFVTESVARSVLRAAGITVAEPVRVALDENVRDRGGDLVFPLVAKIVSPDIQHKTEVGGVLLAIADMDSLADRLAVARIEVASRMPDARLDGWILEPMAPRGRELLVTVRIDPAYGAVVIVGAGGVATELSSDIAARLAPVGGAGAEELLLSTSIGHQLKGFRGADTDLRSIAALIARLSALLGEDDAIREIECNPVIVSPDGGVTIVDTLMRVQSRQA